MATYVTEADFRKWAYIEDGQDTDKITLILDSAEASVDNDLDKASLADYATDGVIPAPLREAIYISAAQSYGAPDDLQHSGVTLMHRYEKLIKPYVKLVADTTATSTEA